MLCKNMKYVLNSINVMFSDNVDNSLSYFKLNTCANIKTANYVKENIFKYIESDGIYSNINSLSFPFEDIYKWENIIHVRRGSRDCFLQRIILSLIITLDEYKKNGLLKSKNNLIIDIMGCLAGICKYINIHDPMHINYTNIDFIKQIQMLNYSF